MRSTWRAVADPTVDFDYNVTPHLVGQLGDLVFDGQTAITQRGLRGRGRRGRRGCNYVGNSRFMPAAPENDPPSLEPYAGPKREFLALAPWVAPDASRERLRAVQAQARPAPVTGSRTTTSRPRSPPIYRSHRAPTGAAASRRPTAAAARATTTTMAR